MALKRLKWLRYLFVGRAEGETEQSYWNEKRRKHLAHEHSAGIVHGLEVTATSPPSLSVRVAGGRAVDSGGNDPEVESVQELDLASLVPPAGEATVYVALSFTESEVEPYFVNEISEYQDKYIQDGAHLEVLTVPPSAPAIELARVELAAGATEVTDAADPAAPGPNEIDLTYRDYADKEVLSLEDLADVSPDEAAAFNGMNAPSGTNSVATLADVAAAATPSVAGLMAEADKAKLDTVEAGATVAGETGDAHAGITTGNPHSLDAADVGAAPAAHVGAGGAAHAEVTPSEAGFMSAADKAKLDLVAPGQAGWKILDPAGGGLASQMSGMAPGDKFWMLPGTYVLDSDALVRRRVPFQSAVLPQRHVQPLVEGGH
ncbi:MAG: hypothetical protein ACYTKD_19710 [Planctomycetota bacterium]|jgi:hypothetical protein